MQVMGATIVRCLIAAISFGGFVACADTMVAVDAASASDAAIQGADRGPLPDAPLPVPITGTVRAPEGTIPISGALVYAVSPSKPPAPIPDKVYCDKCVELTTTTPHTTSKPNGSFALDLPFAGKWLLVTQKGAFRRVREIDVSAAGKAIDEKLTTLPAKTDVNAGDTIPKMAVIRGAWDGIQDSLAKLGLGQVDVNGTLKPGTEPFTMVDCTLVSLFPPKVDCKPHAPDALLTDYNLLSKYQILFVPCDGDPDDHTDTLDATFSSPAAKQNLLKWIKEGGRLYVTDYRYDLLQQILPSYITWEGQSSSPGSAELSSSYTAPATVADKGLKDWLGAQGIVNFDLLESYTVIKGLAKAPTPGPDQKKTYNLAPKAWILGDVKGYAGLRPMTVSYPYGCGRVLFSSYHTEGKKSATSLLPQEKALLYILLEVAVCIKEPLVE